jgi:hypothetical protein
MTTAAYFNSYDAHITSYDIAITVNHICITSYDVYITSYKHRYITSYDTGDNQLQQLH